MSKVEAIAKPAESKPYDQLRRKWRGARKLFFEITNRIETDAAPGGKNVKAAISYLKGVDDWSSLAKMRGAPTAAIPKAWRQHVLDHEGSVRDPKRSEEHTSELQSLMRISYAVLCLQKKKSNN